MPVVVVPTADAVIEVEDSGTGDPVVLLPSLARSCADFAGLTASLDESGFRCLGVNPRQIGNSQGTLCGITLHELAADVAAVIVSLDAGRVHVVGHAFGNRLARCLAADHPHLVRRLVLVAAGGRFSGEPEARDAMIRVLKEPLTPAERLPLVQTALFAKDSDATAWSEGWWPQTGLAQIEVARATVTEQWWAGGSASMLVVQGLADRLAPPSNGRALKDDFPYRIRLVELSNAGHAMLPERPAAIAEAVLGFLGDAAAIDGAPSV